MKQKRIEPIQDIRPMTRTYYRPAAPEQPQPTEAVTPEPPKKQKKKGFRWGWFIFTLFMIIIVIPLVVLGIILAMDAKNFASASQKLFGTSNITEMFPTKSLQTSADGNVHILVAGYSADDPGHGGATLTDSIMVLSINQNTGKGYMLSIPRDLYVQIPGHGSAKINEAYQDGEQTAGGTGMDTLTQVVENVTGLDIPYYFLVNYTAVRDIVDALGGITVTIDSPDPRGIYDPGFKPEEGGPLKLPNGDSEINGQTALNLTRARGLAAGSYGFPQADFNRAQHQQAVVKGILNELSWRAILDPRQNQALFDAVANNVQTNLPINQLIPFARMLLKVNPDQLANYTLRDFNGTNYVTSYTTPAGQSALVPTAGKYDYSNIHAAVAQAESTIAQ